VKFVYLGQTGLKVSELCLGTITSDRETDENTARRMMDYFVKVEVIFLNRTTQHVGGNVPGGSWR